MTIIKVILERPAGGETEVSDAVVVEITAEGPMSAEAMDTAGTGTGAGT